MARRPPRIRARLAAPAAALLALAAACGAPRPGAGPGPRPVVSFNQHFVEGARARVDLSSPDSVFALVFAALPARATVYPSENYYYFSFNAAGRTVWGNLRLDASDRDRGVVHLGYFHYDENGRFQDREGTWKAFSAADGVRVRRAGELEYDVRYRGRTVRLRLHPLAWSPPPAGALAPSEVYVGPVFDESGLRFVLLFDHATRHFLYLLDRWSGPVPEELEPAGEGLLLGRRTGFAFYADRRREREVLVAVHGRNAERNNYYDGPFDQLPDNLVARTGIRRWIEAAYPWARGRVDDFGRFVDQPGARVAITPYLVYYRPEELAFVGSCARSGLAEAEFNACITPDFQQHLAAPGPAGAAPTRVVGEALLTGRVREPR